MNNGGILKAILKYFINYNSLIEIKFIIKKQTNKNN